MDVVRDRGSLFRETDEGLIENTYTIKIINKSQQDQTFMLKFTGLQQASWIGEQESHHQRWRHCRGANQPVAGSG